MAKVDVAVVGLGAMGSAVLYQLAKSSATVVGLDRYAPPHALGSSHGASRITRQGVGEGAEYVHFVQRSHEIWRELEAATGTELLNACGALLIAPATETALHHGKPDFVTRSADAASRFGIPHELMAGAEASRRFSQFPGLTGDEKVYYEPGGGYVMPERCIEAQLARAGELGAEIRTGVTVTGIAQDRSGIRIETSDGAVRADRAVVAAGAWMPILLPALGGMLTVTRQLLHWYELDDRTAYDETAPVFIWTHGSADADYFYGFPPLPGERRIKVATEQYAVLTTADAVERNVAAAESSEMYRRHVAGRLAGVTPRVSEAAACLYTVTPDHGFIIDEHPDMDRVLLVSACSGHGFKHSAGIGEAVAQSLAAGRCEADLSPFRLSRFGSA